MDDTAEQTPAPKPEIYSTAPKWDERTSLLFGAGFAALLMLMGLVFWPVIPFALTTVIIAYLLDPITDFFHQRVTGGSRGFAILLTFLTIILVVLVAFVLLLPPLVEQTVNSLGSLYNSAENLVTEPYEPIPIITHPETDEVIALSEYISILLQEQGFDTFNDWLVETGRNLQLDRDTILQLFNVGGNVTSSIVGSVFSIAGSALGLVFSTLFFITILAQLLGTGDNIARKLIEVAPPGYGDDARRLMTDLGGVWDGYVRGNITLGLIMGTAMWILAVVLGLPNPLFLAFVAFSMEFIPNIGPTISMIAAIALALVGGSSMFPDLNVFVLAGIIAVIWMVMQQIEAVVLVPRIVGENLQLHPSIVILSVIWGGTFGGLIGVIIAPPLVASARIILQYIYGRLTGQPAFIQHKEDDEFNPMKSAEKLIYWVLRRGPQAQTAESDATADAPDDDTEGNQSS